MGVFRSSNNGASWTQIGLNDTSVLSLIFSGTNLVAGTSAYGVFISSDSGATWNETGLGGTSVSSLALIPEETGSCTDLLAGDNAEGVFLSTDNGLNWKATNTGLTKKSVYHFSCRLGSEYIRRNRWWCLSLD